jgi:hypothetical protein
MTSSPVAQCSFRIKTQSSSSSSQCTEDVAPEKDALFCLAHIPFSSGAFLSPTKTCNICCYDTSSYIECYYGDHWTCHPCLEQLAINRIDYGNDHMVSCPECVYSGHDPIIATFQTNGKFIKDETIRTLFLNGPPKITPSEDPTTLEGRLRCILECGGGIRCECGMVIRVEAEPNSNDGCFHVVCSNCSLHRCYICGKTPLQLGITYISAHAITGMSPKEQWENGSYCPMAPSELKTVTWDNLHDDRLEFQVISMLDGSLVDDLNDKSLIHELNTLNLTGNPSDWACGTFRKIRYKPKYGYDRSDDVGELSRTIPIISTRLDSFTLFWRPTEILRQPFWRPIEILRQPFQYNLFQMDFTNRLYPTTVYDITSSIDLNYQIQQNIQERLKIQERRERLKIQERRERLRTLYQYLYQTNPSDSQLSLPKRQTRRELFPSQYQPKIQKTLKRHHFKN